MRTGLFVLCLALSACNCQPPVDPCLACLPSETCREGACFAEVPDSGTAIDSGIAVDSGIPDSGTPDAGSVVDSGTPDAGIPDAGPVDAGKVDAGTPIVDAGIVDAGVLGSNDGGLWCIQPTALNVTTDIRTASLTVTLTLNGLQYPNGTATRGLLVFMDREWDDNSIRVDLSATGPATATATLLQGTYDVVLFTQGVIAGVPTGSVTVARGLVLSATTAQTFDLKSYSISGSVTLNGQPTFPTSSSDRGFVSFREPTGHGVVSFKMGLAGAVTYSGYIFGGTFDVVLESSVPLTMKRKLASSVAITGASTRTDNLPLSTVSGTVSLNGQAFPNGSFIRASIEFYEPSTAQSYFFSAGITGAAAYSAPVPPSTYEVYLNTHDTAPAPLPVSARTRLATGLVVTGAATVNWNVETIDFTGTLTLNGQSFPLPPVSGRGGIWLRNQLTNYELALPLPDTGPATVTAKIFKGTYDIGFQAPNYPIVGVPFLYRAPISLNRALTGSITLPMNLDTVAIDTTLLIDGQPRVGAEWTSSISFVDRWGGTMGRNLPASGPAQLQVIVYKNVPYDVGASVSPMPGVTATGWTTLLHDVSFQTSGPLTLNAKTILASGTITHNGMTFPNATKSQGEIHATNMVNRWPDKLDLGVTGPVTLSTKIFASPRDLTFQASFDPTGPLGLTSNPFGTPPRRLARSCLASECRATSNDVTGTWHVTVLGFFGEESKVALVEQAGAITGQIASGVRYAAINRGSRQGTTVRFDTNSYGNAGIYTATMESPCRMSGTYEGVGYSKSKFVAIR